MPPLSRRDQASPQVREFRNLLDVALSELDGEGREVGDAQYGVYAFFDYEGEPIYVGQTNEKLRTRIRRHLTNQRTDAVAMRVLDVFEVAALELWPLWELEAASCAHPRERLNEYEYSAYREAVANSAFGVILNEKVPSQTAVVEMPTSYRASLVASVTDGELAHVDVRLARRAETLSRLADVIRERGEVSTGLRRVLVIQAARVSLLAASRYSEVLGAPIPPASAIDIASLINEGVTNTTGSGSAADE
jgi:hypothetical protein